jgi:uncharacterized membrane protein YdbT with pleckstrin-like domain
MYKAIAQLIKEWLKIPPPPESPPGDESATVVFRASPQFYRYRIFGWVLGQAPVFLISAGVVIGGVVAATTAGGGMRFFLPVALLVLVIEAVQLAISWVCVRLDYENRWYVLTNRSLRVREGVIIVREMTVTFANIQNLAIDQGPVQRFFRIADLRVDTAGGGGHESHHGRAGTGLHTAAFRGVDNAADIKQLMQQRLRNLKDAGLGDVDDAEAAVETSESVGALLREMVGEAAGLRAAVTRLAQQNTAR